MQNTKLYQKIIRKQNIYNAIYSLNSYVFEKELLSTSDYKLLTYLKDNFNEKLIIRVVKKVQTIIEEVLINDNFFSAQVYFRPKRVNKDEPEFRPIHTADLYTQIAIVAMLNSLLLEEVKQENGKDIKKIELSEFARITPENFYGNIPSEEAKYLFVPWQQQYKKYSNDITNSYTKFLETGEYKFEVTLDLINFFPSINPLIVFKQIVDRFSVKYLGDELACLKRVLIKLLIFDITNIEQFKSQYYCHPKSKIDYEKINTCYSQGIPQGLPQSYFFGNICMIKVSEVFEKAFPGKSYYYVDDSVIYTNEIGENNLKEDFNKKIQKINEELKKVSGNNDHTYLQENNYDELISFNKINNYCIKVHDPEDKSGIAQIDEAKEGQATLNLMSKEASLGAFELNTIFSENEDITLKNKFEVLMDSIEKEIKRVKQLEKESKNKDKFEQYKKMLFRFRKFFKFRNRLLEYKIENKIITDDDNVSFIEKSLIIKNGKTLEEKTKIFFESYDEDIFLVELLFILKNSNIFNKNTITNIEKKINEFDKILLGDGSKEAAYLTRVTNFIIEWSKQRTLLNCVDKYNTLSKKMSIIINNNHQMHKLQRYKLLFCFVNKINKEKNIFRNKAITKNNYLNFDTELYSMVAIQTQELTRMIINAYISKVLNVSLNDGTQIRRLSSSPLLYEEFRLLIYVRNKIFSVSDFCNFFKNLMSNKTNKIIDYSLLEIVDYFMTFVKIPNFVDNLIQIHKYTNEIWKNGSKFLHFYTLHNHEHAVELIKSSITFIKNLDYFQIAKTDYYILFLSCYLHDVSMVLHPDLKKDFSNTDYDSKQICSDFKDEIDNLTGSIYFVNSSIIRKLLLDFYQKMDQYYEKKVRSNHSKDSSRFIRNTTDLEFIKECIKETVAEVSEAHGYDTCEIYGLKSQAKNSLISKKFLKILLRLADLMDMADSRITNPILKNNQDFMGDTTVFHWLSHKAISGYEITTKFENIYSEQELDAENSKKSFLHMKSIKENIYLTINLKSRHIASTKSLECQKVSLCDSSDFTKGFELKVNLNEDKCKTDNCNFLCKWMAKKNEYLYDEMHSLQKYLSRNHNNYFDTNIYIRYICTSDVDYLTNEEHNRIEKYINS